MYINGGNNGRLNKTQWTSRILELSIEREPSKPKWKKFDDNDVIAPKYPREDTAQLAELEAQGSQFHSVTENERNKRVWLRQVSLLAAGYIPQVL